MKVSTLVTSALLGMLSVGGTVYAVTPPGGMGAKVSSGKQAGSTAAADGADASSSPSSNVPGPTKKATSTEFHTGSTLQVDGRIGNPAMLAGSSQETYVLLELTPSAALQAKSPRVSLSLVIDKSGSMAGAKMKNALAAAVTAVKRLNDGDTVSVVAFDTKTELVVPPTRLDGSSRSGVETAINNIHLGGDTCISCGLDEGLNQLANAKRSAEPDVERMVLLSDGAPTAGVRDPEGFTTLSKRALGKGIGITTVGVALEYNERVMTAIAIGSNGGHYFVENESGLSAVFESEAAELKQTVAAGATAQIDLGPGVEMLQLPDREFERNGSRITVPLGGFSKGTHNTVLMKVRLNNPQPGPFEIANVRVNYRDLTKGTNVEEQGTLAVDIVSSSGEVADMDGVVLDRVQKTETAAALLEANRLFSAGKANEAQKRLEAARTSLNAKKAKASHASPASRSRGVEDSFEKQDKVLKRAEGEFSPRPPQPTMRQPGASPPPPAPAPAAAPRANAEDAFRQTR